MKEDSMASCIDRTKIEINQNIINSLNNIINTFSIVFLIAIYL